MASLPIASFWLGMPNSRTPPKPNSTDWPISSATMSGDNWQWPGIASIGFATPFPGRTNNGEQNLPVKAVYRGPDAHRRMIPEPSKTSKWETRSTFLSWEKATAIQYSGRATCEQRSLAGRLSPPACNGTNLCHIASFVVPERRAGVVLHGNLAAIDLRGGGVFASAGRLSPGNRFRRRSGRHARHWVSLGSHMSASGGSRRRKGWTPGELCRAFGRLSSRRWRPLRAWRAFATKSRFAIGSISASNVW